METQLNTAYYDEGMSSRSSRLQSITYDILHKILIQSNGKAINIYNTLDIIDVLSDNYSIKDSNERLFDHVMSIITAAKRLERFPDRLDREGFANRAGSDSSSLPMEVGRDAESAFR